MAYRGRGPPTRWAVVRSRVAGRWSTRSPMTAALRMARSISTAMTWAA